MTGCRHIDEYIDELRSGRTPACREMLLACDYIERRLSEPGVVVDVEKTDRAIELIEKYFSMKLFPWERFIIALVHCFHSDENTVVFSKFLIEMGRGNGKNGFISGLVWYLSSKAHGIRGYNVDIIANSEDQAKTSFDDVYRMLERTRQKSRKFFRWTLEKITNTDTGSYIKYNTANARTKDGKRPGCLVFDEIHEYENYNRINVMRSAFGKIEHAREFYITTNGYVREGVLDEEERLAHDILNGVIEDSRECPLIWKLDSESEIDDPAMWVKANPSLPYRPTLRQEIEESYKESKVKAETRQEILTKRFNLPRTNLELAVTDYDRIKATNQPLNIRPGAPCTVGIDYAEFNDWAAVNFHFRDGQKRLDLNHAWICRDSPTLARIKAPWRDWVDQGLCSFVEDVSISPDLIADYIATMGRQYIIRMLAMDNFRWSAMSDSLRKIGFDANDKKRVKLVRPSDIMRIDPVIQTCFLRNLFVWGDNPCLRWATNNTKRVRSSQRVGCDTGNFVYAKIEAKSRKTDPFMALVASMTCEEVLGSGKVEAPKIGVIKI